MPFGYNNTREENEKNRTSAINLFVNFCRRT